MWLVGTDTPQDARDYLTTTFAEQNPGSKIVIEEQQWTGLVDKLTTSLSSNDSPDIVEMGNTQAPAFTSAGALADLSGIQADLGRVPAAGHAGVISPDGLDDERCPVTGFDLTDLGDVRRREAM